MYHLPVTCKLIFFRISNSLSYWKNNRDRILSQMVVWLKKSELPRSITQHQAYNDGYSFGAILPKVSIPNQNVTGFVLFDIFELKYVLT